MHTYSDQPEPLGRPLAGSVLFHALVFGAVALAGYLHLRQNADSLGSLDGASQKFGEISAVETMPLPRRHAPPNPVANDVDTDLPKAKPKPREVVHDEPDAISLRSKKVRKKERDKPVERASVRDREEPVRPNQMTTDSARALSSYLTGLHGAGGVGLTEKNPFGQRFGAYAALLQRIVTAKWQAQGINVKTGQPALVTVEIQRDGSYRIVQVAQTSGNYAVDTGAKRALIDVGRFPNLPPDFDRASAVVDFSFRVL